MREIGILDRRIAQTRFHIEQAWREYHHLFLSRGAKVKGKVNNIQGLRAFAAIAVAGFHTRFRFPHMRLFGSFGVEVFFVISGYIMASICVSNSEFFFRRRLLRIVPPYWTATVVMFLAALWFPNLMWTTRPDVGELIKSLLFIPFSRSDGSIEPILSIGWTLNCEMYFYAVLAVSLLIFRRRALWLAAGIILAVTETCMRFGGQSAIGRFYGSERHLRLLARHRRVLCLPHHSGEDVATSAASDAVSSRGFNSDAHPDTGRVSTTDDHARANTGHIVVSDGGERSIAGAGWMGYKCQMAGSYRRRQLCSLSRASLLRGYNRPGL